MRILRLQIHVFPKRALSPVFDPSVFVVRVPVRVPRLDCRSSGQSTSGDFRALVSFDGFGVERTFFVITKLVPILGVSNATVQRWMGDRTNGHCGQNGQNEANISAKRDLISAYPDDGEFP